jgi:DNA-binding transcriptional regulator LsrR (DeoR family)
MNNRMENIDQKILDTIDELRLEHHACTARGIAQKLRMSADMVRYRVDLMRKAGLVKWTPMPGSLVRLDEHTLRKQLFEQRIIQHVLANRDNEPYKQLLNQLSAEVLGLSSTESPSNEAPPEPEPRPAAKKPAKKGTPSKRSRPRPQEPK